ncbi:MAG: YdjY domain-containing protein [bacterium]|nr:YdjY domain-containing protein [bacterium]
MNRPLAAILCMFAVWGLASNWGFADDAGEEEPKFKQFEPPTNAKRLNKEAEVWVDGKNKQVIVDGVVSLTEGQLEMFACPKRTKEHESVVAVNSPAQFVHAGLLAIGAKQGKPVQFQPFYTRATGGIIDITAQWYDKAGKLKEVPAQKLVRYVKTKKPLDLDWVFAGSGFWTDKRGVTHYQGDAGDFICVSNFPTATLDLPVESSQVNDNLLFEVNVDLVPVRGTPIRLILKPRPPKTGKPVETTKPDTSKEIDPLKPADPDSSEEKAAPADPKSAE